jgi:hypothetical protein
MSQSRALTKIPAAATPPQPTERTRWAIDHLNLAQDLLTQAQTKPPRETPKATAYRRLTRAYAHSANISISQALNYLEGTEPTTGRKNQPCHD